MSRFLGPLYLSIGTMLLIGVVVYQVMRPDEPSTVTMQPTATPSPTATPRPTPTLSDVVTRPTTYTVGVWRDNRFGVEQRIMIQREGDTYRLEQRFADGSSIRKRLIKQGIDRYIEQGSDTIYVVNRAGDLEIRDRIGLISTARRTR